MTGKEILELIKIYEEFKAIDSIIMLLDGNCGLDNEKFPHLYNLPELIKKHSKYRNREDYDDFYEILGDREKTAEEKLEMIL